MLSLMEVKALYKFKESKNGRKSLVFVRNKNREEILKEKLTDSEMVFATENGMTIYLRDIVQTVTHINKSEV